MWESLENCRCFSYYSQFFLMQVHCYSNCYEEVHNDKFISRFSQHGLLLSGVTLYKSSFQMRGSRLSLTLIICVQRSSLSEVGFCFLVTSCSNDKLIINCPLCFVVFCFVSGFKNYMTKAGGTFVDVKDSACLEENSRELKVFIRRKHLPAVHR